jgi:hypothetical protein
VKTDTPKPEDHFAGCSPQLRAVLRIIAEWVVEAIDREAREQAEEQAALIHTPRPLKTAQRAEKKQSQGGS